MTLAAWQANITDGAGNTQASASVQVIIEQSGDAYKSTATLGSFSRVWRHVPLGLLSESDTVDSGSITYEPTAAEGAAGVTIVNQAIPSSKYSGGVFYPERYGTNTAPGTTEMSAAIQAAINVAEEAGGGVVQLSATNYFLGTTALTVPGGVSLLMQVGGKFTADTSPVASMPLAYIVLAGDNITLDGLFLDYGALNVYSSYSENGIFIALTDGVDHIEIKNCRSLGPIHSVWGGASVDDVTNVRIFNNAFASHDADIYYIGTAPEHWSIRDNVFVTQRPQELRVGGAIYISPAVDPSNPLIFKQSNYDNDRGFDIGIVNNTVRDVVGRPIRVNNCVKVVVSNNRLKLKHGTYTAPDVGDDALTFDMVRDLTVTGNIILGGGENAVDLQSVIGATVTGNEFRENNTVGIAISPSDLWVVDTANRLSRITDRTILHTRDVAISGNFIHSYHGIFFLGSGQNIHVHGNLWKPYTGSTYNDGTTTPLPFAINTDNTDDLFDEGPSYWLHDIRLQNNRHVQNPPVRVTAEADNDTLTVVDGVHEFQTGDPVEIVAAGTSTTVDMPGGLTYTTVYHVIRTSATTFKLATTRANAFAGTAVGISSDGLTTGGAQLYVKDAPYRTQLSISASYYSASSNLQLDPTFPYDYFNAGYADFPLNHATSTTVLLKNARYEFWFNPASTYGGGPSQKGAYENRLLLQDRVLSDGTDTYGLEVTDFSRGAMTFVVGDSFAKYPGVSGSGTVRISIW